MNFSEHHRAPAAPDYELSLWQVVLVERGERHGLTTIHLVGCDFERMRYRVSSHIETYDASTSCVATSSGRIYRLVGPTRYDAGAAEFYRNWLAKRGHTSKGHISDDFGRVLSELALRSPKRRS